jgi:hypothetical protein
VSTFGRSIGKPTAVTRVNGSILAARGENHCGQQVIA